MTYSQYKWSLALVVCNFVLLCGLGTLADLALFLFIFARRSSKASVTPGRRTPPEVGLASET